MRESLREESLLCWTKGLVTVWFHVDATQREFCLLLWGFCLLLCPCGPSMLPPQGPDVRLISAKYCNLIARTVIGPLTKTQRRTKTGSPLRRSICAITALRHCGTITKPKRKRYLIKRGRRRVDILMTTGQFPARIQQQHFRARLLLGPRLLLRLCLSRVWLYWLPCLRMMV